MQGFPHQPPHRRLGSVARSYPVQLHPVQPRPVQPHPAPPPSGPPHQLQRTYHELPPHPPNYQEPYDAPYASSYEQPRPPHHYADLKYERQQPERWEARPTRDTETINATNKPSDQTPVTPEPLGLNGWDQINFQNRRIHKENIPLLFKIINNQLHWLAENDPAGATCWNYKNQKNLEDLRNTWKSLEDYHKANKPSDERASSQASIHFWSYYDGKLRQISQSLIALVNVLDPPSREPFSIQKAASTFPNVYRTQPEQMINSNLFKHVNSEADGLSQYMTMDLFRFKHLEEFKVRLSVPRRSNGATYETISGKQQIRQCEDLKAELQRLRNDFENVENGAYDNLRGGDPKAGKIKEWLLRILRNIHGIRRDIEEHLEPKVFENKIRFS